MSEWSQGPGWWVASDGKWYPPESHPSHRAPVAPPPPVVPSPEAPQRSWLARRWWLVFGIVLVIAIPVVYAAGNSATNTSTIGTGLGQRTEVECESDANWGCTTVGKVKCMTVAQATEYATGTLPDGVVVKAFEQDLVTKGAYGWSPAADDWIVVSWDDQGDELKLFAVPPDDWTLDDHLDERCREAGRP